jgi:hypothetical protein
MTGFPALKFLFAAGVALALLAGCETPPPPSGFPQLSYAHLPPIKLNVAEIKIVSEYRSTGVAPNVEHLFPVKPQVAAERWSRERLKPVGRSGMARVTIRRASVVEVPLARSTGVRGMLTTDQAERYDGVIEIAIAIIDANGRQLGAVVSRAQRSKSVPENISVYDREKTWFDMVEAMMNDINVSLETQIKKHLRASLR